MKTSEVDALLAVLTKHGVREYADGDLKIVLFRRDEVECGVCGKVMLAKVIGGHVCPLKDGEVVAVPTQVASQAAEAIEEPVDPRDGCGHPLSEHDDNGVCVRGCAIGRCAATKSDLPPGPP